MDILYSKCEHQIVINHEKITCNEKIPYLSDQLLVSRYCKFHFPLYTAVYFKKQQKKI